MTQAGSKRRMLAAAGHQPPEYLPCCFMSFIALRRRCSRSRMCDEFR